MLNADHVFGMVFGTKELVTHDLCLMEGGFEQGKMA